MPMTAAEVARRCDGSVIGDVDASVASWTFDSRSVGAGACFVALRGHRDGHDFVRDAFRRGAHVALVERAVATEDLGPGRALVKSTARRSC